MKYWVFMAINYSDGAILSTVPASGPRANKYRKGKSLKGGYPKREEAKMYFDPNHPDKIKLYDIVKCLDGVFAVSQEVKVFFEEQGIAEEFLPVRLMDHQDNFVSDDYFIFNHLELVDFIDMEKSKVSFNPLFPDRVRYIKNLVINSSFNADAKIFAPANMTRQLFINDDFKMALEKAGIKGYKVFEADGWDGLPV